MTCRTAALACLIVGSVLATPQGQAPQVEWSVYGGDPSGSKYSPADEITSRNIQRLQIADRKSTRLNSSHPRLSRMPSSA